MLKANQGLRRQQQDEGILMTHGTYKYRFEQPMALSPGEKDISFVSVRGQASHVLPTGLAQAEKLLFLARQCILGDSGHYVLAVMYPWFVGTAVDVRR